MRIPKLSVEESTMPESSPLSCGLYPLVQDITDVAEYGTWCCGDGTTQVIENFSLADLATPTVTPRSIYGGEGADGGSSPSSRLPRTPSSQLRLNPLSPESSPAELVINCNPKSTRLQNYSPKAIINKSMFKHRRQSSASKLVECEKQEKKDGEEARCDSRGRKATQDQIGRRWLRRRTCSSHSIISDTADSTTMCSAREAEERILITEAFKFHDAYVLTRQVGLNCRICLLLCHFLVQMSLMTHSFSYLLASPRLSVANYQMYGNVSIATKVNAIVSRQLIVDDSLRLQMKIPHYVKWQC